MPTQNIECQLAQGQIGRYINGDRFSTEAVKQLESHIAECDDCSQLLSKRREAVIAMLGGRAQAVVQTEVPSPAATAAVKLLRAITKGETPTELQTVTRAAAAVEQVKPKLLPSLFTKPVLYCAGLAIVLMGMSYLSRGATKVFGPNASQALPADAPLQTPQPAPKPKPISVPSTAMTGPTLVARTAAKPTIVNKPALKPISVAKPTAKPTHAPTPIAKPSRVAARHVHARPKKPRIRIGVHRLVRHPARHRSHTAFRTRARRAPLPSHTAGVRVYDPAGHPLR
jgi:hypothetical protein